MTRTETWDRSWADQYATLSKPNAEARRFLSLQVVVNTLVLIDALRRQKFPHFKWINW